MDQFNVISLTNDIAELELDMNRWSNMPYDMRKRSDEDCIRLHGMTNIQLYNKIKAGFMKLATLEDDNVVIGNSISEAVFVDSENHKEQFELEDIESFNWKLKMVDNLEVSPLIVIISPFRSEEQKYSIAELNDKFNRFSSLTIKNQRISNAYSLDLWGYNVPDMYNIMVKKLNINDNDTVLFGYSEAEQFMNCTVNSINEKILSNDKIGLALHKLDACNKNISPAHKSIYEYMNTEMDDALLSGTFDTIPSITPYFTPDEMYELGLVENKVSNMEYEDYYKALQTAMESGNEKDILSLGWNPSVSLTEKNFKFARERQIKWLKEHAANVIDICKFCNNDKLSLEESTKMMNDIYKSKNLHPIYIVLSFSNTKFGRLIRRIKNCTYSHAGLALDSNLKAIYSFDFGKKFNGFSRENIDKYISNSEDAIIDVLAVFVDAKTKDKIENTIKHFDSIEGKTKYGFGNLINILLNKPTKKSFPDNLSLVCSQFVDTILKLANIDITSKSSNLVIPQDFETTRTSNPKVFKLYEGLAKDYIDKNVEAGIRLLFDTRLIRDLRYTDTEDFFGESAVPSSFSGTIIDNNEANTVLEKLHYLTTPELVLVEKKLPIKFTDDGDLSINLIKSLEDEYQEAHKLLTSYNESNLVGIKNELARLFYINSAIEKKIKKMKRDDDQYKKYINLRARVLNDFKKYIKVVTDTEPEFNFTEYFKSSDYSNDNLVIDNSTLKYSGKLIGKILKKKPI